MLEAIPYEPAAQFSGVPEVTGVEYDLWVLRITLSFQDFRSPVYAEFHNVEGFRVLDEGQLSSWWHKSLPAGWLWRVQSGGWVGLESNRSDFTISAASSAELSAQEYLVGGINDCVSVIARSSPRVSSVAP